MPQIHLTSLTHRNVVTATGARDAVPEHLCSFSDKPLLFEFLLLWLLVYADLLNTGMSFRWNHGAKNVSR